MDFEFHGPLRPLGIRTHAKQVVYGRGRSLTLNRCSEPASARQNESSATDFADYASRCNIAKFLLRHRQIGPLRTRASSFSTRRNSRANHKSLVFGEAFRLGVDRNNPITVSRGRIRSRSASALPVGSCSAP